MTDVPLDLDPRAFSAAPPAPAASLVVFGAGGDLTKRLLVPALYNLTTAGLLGDGFAVIGIDHVPGDDAGFAAQQTETIHSFVATKGTDKGGEFSPAALDEAAWARLRGRLSYLCGDFNDPGTYRRLGERLAAIRQSRGHGNAVFYLATAPRFFGPIAEQLAAAGLLREEGGDVRRLVIEKPFGTDLASARALNARLLGLVPEAQLFRIDHFLGKETVQNIMALRFGNGIFEPLWHRDQIDHVQITAAETLGVEARGSFYETTGALRDMVPNHMMQLLAMTAMEPPNSFGADAIRAEKAKVIQAIRPMRADEVARDTALGQYGPGTLGGTPVAGYRQEPHVAPDSVTATYIALQLQIDNWRWAGVPFYLRTGKRLATRRTEIAIQFRQAPHMLFRDRAAATPAPNLLVLHVQPSEGASLHFSAKVPGPAVELDDVRMDFRYVDWFRIGPSTGYETLLYDVLIGDATLFQRADNVEAGWAAVEPVLRAETHGQLAVEPYAAGSDGPAAAQALLARDGRRWLALT